MTERRRRPRPSATLQRFLDGYLHQDFRLEHGDAVAAARAFAGDASEAERRWARAALDRFTEWARTVDEAAWRAEWKTLGGAWRPADLGAIRAVSDALGADR